MIRVCVCLVLLAVASATVSAAAQPSGAPSAEPDPSEQQESKPPPDKAEVDTSPNEPEPPPPSEAQMLKAQGDAAMKRLAYEQALRMYQNAYALEPTPALSYNKGRALQALTRYPEALAELEAFEREASPDLKARVPRLAELLEDLRARVATLQVTCNVAGARVLLGRRVIGKTPLKRLRVNAGRVTLEVTKEGYHPYRKRMALRGNSVQSVKVELLSKSTTGVLEVTSPVAGATVFVNDKKIGTVPAQAQLTAGEHQVVVRREGYDEARTSAVVRVGRVAKLNVALDEPPGITSRWWFWTGIGVAVAGGTALTIALLTERSTDEGDIAPGKVAGPLVRF